MGDYQVSIQSVRASSSKEGPILLIQFIPIGTPFPVPPGTMEVQMVLTSISPETLLQNAQKAISVHMRGLAQKYMSSMAQKIASETLVGKSITYSLEDS